MTVIFYFEQYRELAKSLAQKKSYALGELEFRRFPEGESYVRIKSEVKNKKIILLCGLENADEKIMALMFFCQTAKELGAAEITLVAPYLGYMRMDKRFNDGEAITSNIFAKFLSQQINQLVTIDPHLHRHKTLEEIYSIPCQTLTAAPEIAKWIKKNIVQPILIGPDEESEQWVKKVAQAADVPFVILQKIRRGDYDVEVSFPQIEKYRNHIPVLVDDIIATASTMIETINHLKKLKTLSPVCIGTHAIFVGRAFDELKTAGASQIVSCNTITHATNAINIEQLLAEAL